VIFVEYQGRLGNQMFEFAFALAAAKRLRTEFAMCDSTWYGVEDEQLSGLSSSTDTRASRSLAMIGTQSSVLTRSGETNPR
jgi:hypothetical protein